MKIVYECSHCSREIAMFLEIPIVETDKQLYTQWVGQSNRPHLIKLPLVLLRVDQQGNCTVENIIDNLGDGKWTPISNRRRKEIGLLFKCTYCGGERFFVLGVGIICNREDNILLQKDISAYTLPIVLLSDDRHGNFSVATFLSPTPEPTDDSGVVGLDLLSAEDYNKRGSDYYSKQQYNLAIADFTRAIELNPSFYDAYCNRGEALRDDGQYALAILDFNKAIELNPSALAYFGRGLTYSLMGLYDLAIPDFSKAIELDHSFAQAYYNRAGAYYNTGNYNSSLADLNRVIWTSTDPNLTQLARQAITKYFKGK